ncbi:MAG: IS110 family transposase [Bacilli bacterium]|nr:IS110 family transposase [Bacilli bacterium]
MDFYVGIDVSKHKHTVAIIDQEANVISKPHNIANTKEGFDSLLNELGLLGPKEQIKIGLEATGHYMNCLVRYLVKNGYQVQIYNPFLIDNYRKSNSNNAAKTDNLDALLISQYVSTHAFASTPQISYLIEEVRKISRAKYFFADKIRAYNHLQRYLDEVFLEFCSFFNKKEDESNASKGTTSFESKAIRWLLLNYPSASKIAKM